MFLFWAQTFPLLCSDFIDPPWKLNLAPCKQIPVVHFSVYIHRDLQIHISNVVVKEESESDVSQSCRTLCSPWTVAHHTPPSMGFSRQEHWSGLSFPSLGDLPDPGIEPGSPTLQADALLSEPPGKPNVVGVPVISSPVPRCSPSLFR